MPRDEKQANLYTTQQSLTEWLGDIKHAKADKIRIEDNEKRERLRELKGIIGTPFDEPVQFHATDLAEYSDAFKTYLHKHGDEACALRLIPTEESLPKLRMRGLTVSEAYEWFKQQEIDPNKYRADFMPHVAESRFGTIFVVNQFGIQGEIIRGGHHQLTQGFHDGDGPIMFSFDFKALTLSREDSEAETHLKHIISYLHVTDAGIQKKLSEQLQATFVNDYLAGYFETVDTAVHGLWFVDYNRILGDMFSDAQFVSVDTSQVGDVLHGQVGCKGRVEATAHIVHPDDISTTEFEPGSVLVCEMTSPDYLPLMQKAGAIVTDQGGILSHAAIVARELGIPCIVGVGDATKRLDTGDSVVVDADHGSITLQKAN